MEKIKVLAIAPYEGLGTLIKKVAADWSMLDITVETGNLTEGVKRVQEVTEDEFDVIISRGGTSGMIEKNTSIPVINIAVSGYDCVRAVKLAELNASKVAFIGFSNITRSASITCDLLKSPVGIFTIEREDELEDLLARIGKEGYSVVIGDVVTVKKAKQGRMHGILLTSGEESVAQALDEAVRTVRLLRESKKKQLLLTAIFSKVNECVGIISETGEWVYVSSRHPLDDFKGKISEMLTLALQGENGEMIIHHGTHMYKLMIFPLFIEQSKEHFAGVYLIPVYNDISLPTSISTINPTAEAVNMTYPTFLGKNHIMNENLIKTLKFSGTSGSILIEGERGTGKDSLAYAIHLNSAYKNYPYLTLDCEQIKIADLEYLFDAKGGMVYLGAGGTLYLRGINFLTMTTQHKLVSLLPFQGNYRIVASSTVSLIHLVNDGLFSERLYHVISQFPVHLPPLKERKEDIASLAGLIIAEANSKFGKQVIGFEDDARTILEEYEWPFNIDELRGIIERTVVLTDGPYIKKQMLQSELKTVQTSDINTQTISIANKTLEEIETEVIHMALKAENMNQIKAAKRLGISRSTIWRKFK